MVRPLPPFEPAAALSPVDAAHLALRLQAGDQPVDGRVGLYVGASDLLPESHQRHPSRVTAARNVAGVAVIWLTMHLATL